MGLRDIGATLPPGFRFYPSDEELVCHYLYKKVANEEALKGTLVEIDLHTCEPWQIPEMAKLNANEWYFFSFRDRKYATGFRTNRATTSGYWKATGKDRTVIDPVTRELAGMRKTLVFYRNRAPNGIKTGWIMHEFRLESPHMPPKEDWVLCRVFHKSKGSENNEKLSPQYIFDSTATNNASSFTSSSPPNVDSRMITVPFGYHHHHQQQISSSSASPNNSYHNQMLNLLQFPSLHDHEKNNKNQSNESSSKNDDHDNDYGFIWDMEMDLQENCRSSLENNNNNNNGVVVASTLEDMRFELDTSMVFL